MEGQAFRHGKKEVFGAVFAIHRAPRIFDEWIGAGANYTVLSIQQRRCGGRRSIDSVVARPYGETPKSNVRKYLGSETSMRSKTGRIMFSRFLLTPPERGC